MTEKNRPSWVKVVLITISSVMGVCAVVVAILFLFIFPAAVTSEGNKLETGINAAYTNGASTLSSCVNQTIQAANVANAQTEAVKKVLEAAVGGRYGKGDQLDRTKLFSALQEAYPDLTGLNTLYQNVLATITGCQIRFEGAQHDVQAAIARFDGWRTGSWRVRNFGGDGFPNETLIFNIGNTQLSGAAALERMRKPIIDQSVSTAYENGTTTQTNPFETPAAPKPSN